MTSITLRNDILLLWKRCFWHVKIQLW